MEDGFALPNSRKIYVQSKKDGEVSRSLVALSFRVSFLLRLSRGASLELCIAVTYTNTRLKGGSSRTGVAELSRKNTGLHQSMETVKIVAQRPKTGHDIVLPSGINPCMCANKIPMRTPNNNDSNLQNPASDLVSHLSAWGPSICWPG